MIEVLQFRGSIIVNNKQLSLCFYFWLFLVILLHLFSKHKFLKPKQRDFSEKKRSQHREVSKSKCHTLSSPHKNHCVCDHAPPPLLGHLRLSLVPAGSRNKAHFEVVYTHRSLWRGPLPEFCNIQDIFSFNHT